MSRIGAGDDLPDGGAPRAPLDALPGRRRHGGHADSCSPTTCRRLLRCLDFIKKAVRDERRRLRLLLRGAAGLRGGRAAAHPARLLGRVQQPRRTSTTATRTWTDWGNEMFVTPGVVVDGELVTTNLVDINLGIRILLGSSYYDDWANEETFVEKDPLGNPVDQRHPWNQTTIPKPQKRDLEGGNYIVGDEPALVRQAHRRPPRARHRRRRRSRGCGRRRWPTRSTRRTSSATGTSVQINLPKTPNTPETDARVEDPAVVERDRARPRADLLRRLRGGDGAALPRAGARARCAPGDVKVFEDFDVPDEAIGCGFHEAVRGVLSHHLVIRDGKIANYHPYPPTPWNGSPTRLLRHARARTRTRCMGHADLRGERPGRLPRHRHHAGGAQLRPVPAVRRAHVPGQGQDARSRSTRRCSASTAEGSADGRSSAASGSAADRGAARASRGASRPGSRETRHELVAALLDLYGEGLRADRGACAGDAGATAVRRRRAGLAPAAAARPASGAGRGAGAGGARRGAARTWSRTAATSSCSASEDGVARLRLEGSCSGCPSSAITLKLGDRGGDPQVGARRRAARGGGRAGAAPAAAPDRRRSTPSAPAGGGRMSAAAGRRGSRASRSARGRADRARSAASSAATPIRAEHRHLLDLDEPGAAVRLPACSLLFDRARRGRRPLPADPGPAAAARRLRARRRRLGGAADPGRHGVLLPQLARRSG